MKSTATHIDGVFVIDLDVRGDDRGMFARTFCERELATMGVGFDAVNMNMAKTVNAATIRGLHYQIGEDAEQKLMRCERGSIFDVVVDMRADSSTYTSWFGIELSEQNGRQLLIPKGCAHGYLTLEPQTHTSYLVSAYYQASAERGVRWDDPTVGIEWPIPPTIVSDKDNAWPLIGEPLTS